MEERRSRRSHSIQVSQANHSCKGMSSLKNAGHNQPDLPDLHHGLEKPSNPVKSQIFEEENRFCFVWLSNLF